MQAGVLSQKRVCEIGDDGAGLAEREVSPCQPARECLERALLSLAAFACLLGALVELGNNG